MTGKEALAASPMKSMSEEKEKRRRGCDVGINGGWGRRYKWRN